MCCQQLTYPDVLMYMLDQSTRNKFQLLVKAHLPTDKGDFDILAIQNDEIEELPHIVLVHRNINLSDVVNVRIHSECITGDVFGSKRCDCGQQLEHSMSIIGQQKGVLIYLRQEGRGIGLTNKLKAYNLQDKGIDTLDANTHLGFEPDERDYTVCLDVLTNLGISKINLITNNPEKMKVFEDSDIEVVDRTPIIIPPNAENTDYIETKRKRMGHLF